MIFYYFFAIFVATAFMAQCFPSHQSQTQETPISTDR